MELRDEFLPGLRQIQARLVVQDVPVMVPCPKARYTDLAVEHRGIGQGLAKEFMTLRGQDSFNVDPGIGFLTLK